MKIGTLMITAGIAALGLVAWNTPSQAQGPMYDRVKVNLPYSVSIGDKTLQPGDYVIQQLRDAGGGSRVLLIYSDNGMKFETSAMTIPALDHKTPENTSIVLHHFGSDYYFDKVWIQGKDYGYEFPLPDSVKAREKERAEPTSVAASYSSVPQTDTSTASAAVEPAETKQPAETKESTTPVQAEAAPQPAAPPQPETPQPPPTTTAQVQTPPSEPAAQPSTPAPAQVTPADTADRALPNSADRAAPETPAETPMPATSAGWLMMLLGGGALSGAGLSLRRKR